MELQIFGINKLPLFELIIIFICVLSSAILVINNLSHKKKKSNIIPKKKAHLQLVHSDKIIPFPRKKDEK